LAEGVSTDWKTSRHSKPPDWGALREVDGAHHHGEGQSHDSPVRGSAKNLMCSQCLSEAITVLKVPSMIDIFPRLQGVRPSGQGWTARCPGHRDVENSLSIHLRNEKWLLHCHAGCAWQTVVGAMGLEPSDLFGEDEPPGRGIAHPRSNPATAQPRPGLSLEHYAAAKGLPVEFLQQQGLSEVTYDGTTAVRMPYLDADSQCLAVRFRIALEGDRFRWKSGTKPCLYGLNRLAAARSAGHVVLVEGESDCQTFWFHDIPAAGIPGAANWREDRDAQHLDGIGTIYVVIEPDAGGQAFKKWLACSRIKSRAKLVRLPVKDPSALHLQDPAAFKTRWQEACRSAVPWTAVQAEAKEEERDAAWNLCAELAGSPSILAEFDRELSRIGVVGERRGAKLIYLALTSRLLDRPVSVAVKGPSSGGKSFLVESTIKFFPQQAYYPLTAMSDRALAYSNEPLQHRFLVIYEAAGMASEFATYLIRSLLSEGRVRYETVEKTKDGFVPRLIERDGPTGLIVTTTSLRLHPENETRMLSLTVTDTREHTAAVIKALARETDLAVDLSRWQALQAWLATGPHRVVIPFAEKLAKLVPPVAVRLRRDFKTVLMLIRAHALLHQSTRSTDEEGRIVAALDDYAQVRELIGNLVAEGAETTVKQEIREVVNAVGGLLRDEATEVKQSDLVRKLRLDKSAISRRVAAAIDLGVLRNLEDRKGRPARLVLGEPIPDDVEILPGPARLRGCAVDEGDRLPPTEVAQFERTPAEDAKPLLAL
jgi:hypothetical protein